MMLDHALGVRTERFPEYGRCLLDDACEGDNVDDAVETMAKGMVERKSQRGQCLAAASRHSEGKQAPRLGCCSPRGAENLGSQPVNVAGPGETRFLVHVGVEGRFEFSQCRPTTTFAITVLDAVVMGFRVDIVGVHEARKEHPNKEANTKAASLEAYRPVRVKLQFRALHCARGGQSQFLTPSGEWGE